MLGMGPNARYADVMEQALYNGSISGLSLDGSRFFYENRLESDGRHNRWIWHRCPCCPPNIGRMVASIGSYFYGQSEDAIAVHLYGDSTARFEIAGGNVTLTQESDYPWDGAIALRVETDRPLRFKLHLRVPGWCRKAALSVNGEPIDLKAVTADGYATLDREWKSGDAVQLDLEMDARRIYANPKVRHDLGRVALARGPVLYCVEATDNSVPLDAINVPQAAAFSASHEPGLMGGVTTLSGTVAADAGGDWNGNLYRSEPPANAEVTVKAVPYFAWDNREPGRMLVWLRRANG
jgi:DUF1680 family protein